MSQKEENKAFVESGTAIVVAYRDTIQKSEGATYEELVMDLLADLMHLAKDSETDNPEDDTTFNFDECVAKAYENFDQELKREADEAKA